MTSHDTTQLAGLVALKRQCLVQIRDLGVRQLQLIDAADMTQLLKILAAKQHLIGQVQQIEQQLEPYRAEDPDRRQWATPSVRERCAAEVRECQQLLDEIVAQERQGESLLAVRRDEVAARLKGAHTARQARDAYLTSGPGGTGMLDLTSGSH